MKTKLILTHAVLYSANLELKAVLAVLASMQWPEPDVEVSIEKLARTTHGRFNPSSDFVLLMPNGALVRNVFGLVHWIEEQGLVPL